MAFLPKLFDEEPEEKVLKVDYALTGPDPTIVKRKSLSTVIFEPDITNG